jgi:O-antigen/teichoic acid export membrane protein
MAVDHHDVTPPPVVPAPDSESYDQRLARNLNELLQELRVAQTGVQFLFGFLLSVAFTEHYARASGFEQVVHLVAVVFATAAVALLTAPAAWHRLLFRRGQRPEIVRVANILAVAGLACLALATTTTVLLLFKVVAGPVVATVFTVLAAATFGLLWFVLPLHARRNAARRGGPGVTPPGDGADGSDAR